MLSGKLALVTGGTDGIGKQAAIRLAQQGAQVILVGRNSEKGAAALLDIRRAVPESRVNYLQADLSLLRQVDSLAEAMRQNYNRVDVLVHCAGVMLPRRVLTAEGLETVFAVQYLARLRLTTQLLDRLTPASRVVSVSAGGTIPLRLDFGNLNGERFYNGVYALMHESIANDVALLRLIRSRPDLRFYNYGPFYVKTGLFDEMPAWFKWMTDSFGRLMVTTAARAADDIAALVASDLPSGLYSRHLKPIRPSRYRADTALQDRLWQVSEQMMMKALTV